MHCKISWEKLSCNKPRAEPAGQQSTPSRKKKKKKKTGNNNNKNLEAYLELLNCKDSVVAVIFILCNVFHVKKYISSWPLISPLQRSMSED